MSSSVIQTSRRLFLHWGPGGNAQVEREYFPAHLGIDFWDRPRNSHPSAFTDGVNATQSHLEKLHAVHGPIDLIAHSFGCAIALELSFRVPTLIRSITLLSGNEDVVRGTYQLAGELVKRGLGSPDLAPTLQAAERFQSWESFQALIPALFTVPHLFSYYWAPESHQAQEKYNGLASGQELIDLPAFFAETENYFHLRAEDKKSPSPFKGRVRLFVGNQDPYLELDTDIEAWKKRFPQLSVHVVESGHFTQFEVSPETWLPEY